MLNATTILVAVLSITTFTGPNSHRNARKAHFSDARVISSDDDQDSSNSDSSDDAEQTALQGLDKLNRQMKCRNACQRESFSCMSRCPNGQDGQSCRAQCQLDSSNCSQSCEDQ